MTGGLSKKTYQRIQREFKEKDVIIHFHNLIGCGMFSYVGHAKVICTLHGCFQQVAQSRISCFIANRTVSILKKHHAIFVGCARAVAEYSESIWPSTNFKTVMNGISFTAPAENKYVGDVRKFNIGFAACLDELKGWQYLIEAFLRIPEDIKQHMHLYLAGYASEEELKVIAKYLDKDEHISFLGQIGDVQTSFLPYVDVLILPSRTEGLPMSILEAMQAKCVPIATPVGGIPELIEDGVSGVFIKRDAKIIADKLCFIYQHPEILRSLKEGAFKRYQSIGTAKRMVDEYSEIYRIED